MAYGAFVSMKPGWEKIVGSTKVRRLGEEGYMFPGRWFRYALAGEAVTVNLLQTSISATDAHDLDLVPAGAISAGDTTTTIASQTATANEYADGWLFMNDVEEEGHNYLIKSNTVASASTLTITLDEEDGFVAASTTSQQMGLMHSHCFDFVVYPTTSTDAPIGAACLDWSDNDYGWLQFRGPGVARVYEGTALLAGNPLGPSTSTAGNVELLDQSGTIDYGLVGWNRDAVGTNGESNAVIWAM